MPARVGEPLVSQWLHALTGCDTDLLIAAAVPSMRPSLASSGGVPSHQMMLWLQCKPASLARMIAWARSVTCSLLKMLET